MNEEQEKYLRGLGLEDKDINAIKNGHSVYSVINGTYKEELKK